MTGGDWGQSKSKDVRKYSRPILVESLAGAEDPQEHFKVDESDEEEGSRCPGCGMLGQKLGSFHYLGVKLVMI